MFIDYSKAFDTVNHVVQWKTLLDYGTPKHLVWLLERLYSEATGVIRVEDGHTDQFPFEKGVRQDCIVSPHILFNACGEAIMRQVEETLYDVMSAIIWAGCSENSTLKLIYLQSKSTAKSQEFSNVHSPFSSGCTKLFF